MIFNSVGDGSPCLLYGPAHALGIYEAAYIRKNTAPEYTRRGFSVNYLLSGNKYGRTVHIFTMDNQDYQRTARDTKH